MPKGDQADEDTDTVVQPDVLVVCDRRLETAARYGRPVLSELKDQTAVTSVPELKIDWNRLLAQFDG